MSARTRILVVDQQLLCRRGIASILYESVPDSQIVSVDSWHRASLMLGDDPSFQFVTYDPSLATGTPSERVAVLRSVAPDAKLAVVDWASDRATALSWVQAGADGYVPKELPRAEMIRAFALISEGQIFVPRTQTGQPAPRRVEETICAPREAGELTARQREVLSHLAMGKSNKEIARALKISESTVKVHVAASFRLLGVHNRVSAVAQLQGRGPAHGAEVELPQLPFGRRRDDVVTERSNG